jgi:HAD superfamily hydrolase (TIGR01549 family)
MDRHKVPMNALFDWIFFDCFNTLIDDFDQTGCEMGLASMYQVPVTAGLYDSLETLRQDYHRWRKAHISGYAQEYTLAERLLHLLAETRPQTPLALREEVVQQMEVQFAQHYPQTLRLPNGVDTMLAAWQGKVRMGVVSNFFLAQWPEKFLDQYGMKPYFDFILDSAACGWRKPGAEIYHLALQAAGNPDPNRVLFIGDHFRNDVQTPLHFGMQALHFDRSSERLSANATPAGFASITHWDRFRPDSGIWQTEQIQAVNSNLGRLSS